MMSKGCSHIAGIQTVTPSALGCDDSPNKHASAHFHATGHPVIEGYDPPEGWGWCYVDKVLFDLSNRKTPHNGPIPRYYLFLFQQRMRNLTCKARRERYAPSLLSCGWHYRSH